MPQDLYTTTEAARLLAVSSDTVLKWVRAGKIPSYRTPGGHARIPRSAIAGLLPEPNGKNGEAVRTPGTESYKYCWDHHAVNGRIKAECRNCIAYKSRARRCYEMRHLPGVFSHLKLQCDTECEQCEYYARTRDVAVSALVVSRGKALVDTLMRDREASVLNLEFADDEYECAAKLERFRPDYVVVDCSLGAGRVRNLCMRLSNDERIPFTRIILCSRTPRLKDYCDNEVFGWITKPFDLSRLEDLVRGLEESHRIPTT